jgi:mRNA interferase MazF
MSGEPGELVAIPFPYSDLHTSKRRPVVIITPPDRHGDFFGLAVTSVPTPEYAVPITSDDLSRGELPKASWVRYDKVFTLSESTIVKQYGKLNPEVLEKALQGFCHYTGCQSGAP